MDHPDFIHAVKDGQNLVNKIRKGIPALHRSYVSIKSMSLHPTSETSDLQLMEDSLKIPQAPALMDLSVEFTLEMCLKAISIGLQMYQDVLNALHSRVPKPAAKDMLIDIKDLLAQITKMQELGRFESGPKYEGSGLASRLDRDFDVQAAAHLSLVQLREFSLDVFRSLRNMTQEDPNLEQELELE